MKKPVTTIAPLGVAALAGAGVALLVAAAPGGCAHVGPATAIAQAAAERCGTVPEAKREDCIREFVGELLEHAATLPPPAVDAGTETGDTGDGG